MGVIPDVILKEGDYDLAHNIARLEMSAFDSLTPEEREKLNYIDSSPVLRQYEILSTILNNGYGIDLKTKFRKLRR